MIEFGGNKYATKKDFERAYRTAADAFTANMKGVADDIILSSYYAQHMAADLFSNKLGFKRWKYVPGREGSQDIADSIYLPRKDTSKMSVEAMKKTLIQMKMYNQHFQNNGVMTKEHINASAKAFMKQLGIKNKKTFARAMRAWRMTDFAGYLVYETDKTDYKTSMSKVAKLIDRGFDEEDIVRITNKMFETSVYDDKGNERMATLDDVEKWFYKTEYMTDEEIAYKWLT